MSYKKLTVIPRTAEEIVGIRGCKAFSCYFEGDDWVYYSRGMNELALKKKRIEVESIDGKYDYIGDNFYWKREWLKYFRKEVDWTKVPIDTKVIVSNYPDFRKYAKRYFAKYKNKVIYCFTGGKASWSDNGKNNVTSWTYAKLAEENLE